MAEFLRIITQDAEVRFSAKNKEFLENKEYLIEEMKNLRKIGLGNRRGGGGMKGQAEDCEEFVEHFQKIAEQSKDLVALHKRKNSALHLNIRDLEVNAIQSKYKNLSNESENLDFSLKLGRSKLKSFQDEIKTNKKVYEAEISQLAQENSLLKSDTIDEFKSIQASLSSEIAKIKSAIEETYNSVEVYQSYLQQKQEKLQSQSDLLEKSSKNYELLQKTFKSLEVSAI